MKTLTCFILLSWLSSTATAQGSADTAVTQIGQLLTPGKHLVHYFPTNTNKSLTAEQKALLVKVRSALSENTVWVLDMYSVKQGSSTRDEILNGIRKKLNLTEGEWATLQDLTDVAKKDVDYYGSAPFRLWAFFILLRPIMVFILPC